MASTLRPIGHEDKLSVVDHLDELRRRLVVCVLTLVVAFGVCFAFNDAVLDFVTEPVETTQNLNEVDDRSEDPLEQSARFQQQLGQALRAQAPALAGVADSLRSLGDQERLSATAVEGLNAAADRLDVAGQRAARAAAAVPANPERNLVTLGVAEPFVSTITISLYAALLLAMPMLLFQLYAFVLPAFSPSERRIAMPLMLLVPGLFIAGVAFGYYVVLDRAIEFLQNFNDDSFDILLQAKDYFRFVVLFVAAMGLMFQVPVAVLAITRTGIMTPKRLAANRGYVILVIAVLSAVITPTPDPVTMLLFMAPLIVLFELSILVARWLERIAPVRLDDEDDELVFDDIDSDRED